MDIIANYPILKSFLAGSFSGTFSTILFQPLDLVKTRLQNNTASLINGRSGNSMVTIFINIIQQEHVRGLWRGMTPSIARCVPGVGLYFSSLSWLKKEFSVNGNLTALQSITLGATARSISGALLIPVTVVKTRFESGVYSYTSVTEALKQIHKTEGFRGLSAGLLPTLFRDAPFSGLYLMFYTQTKQALPKDLLQSQYAAPINFTCGIAAGILASVVTQPADVLKTKMQLYPHKFNGLCAFQLITGYLKTSKMLGKFNFLESVDYKRLIKIIGFKLALTSLTMLLRALNVPLVYNQEEMYYLQLQLLWHML
ncbi:uncharacterized protein CBL_14485 [Carabus blaptoides fortunei]